jgi:hypothetical protein
VVCRTWGDDPDRRDGHPFAKETSTMAGKAKHLVPPVGELYYRLPESAHAVLGEIRDELGMLAHLAQRDCCHLDEPLHVSHAALSQCFARLAVDVGEALDACLAPSEFAERIRPAGP